MAKTFEGTLSAKGLRLAVLMSRFNESVSQRLLEGAQEALARTQAIEDHVEVYKVPGAWELPVLAARLAATGRYDALVALGCVIRGGTPHFEFVCAESTRGLSRVALDHGIPVALGVLTCDTLEQALERSGGKHGNKGAEAAVSAVEMATLLRQVRGGKR
ncbi:MAG: 6,7-dimethyl-8-ribityllumazine synthase [Deltaproteobacteria bacterium RBG_13_65_10]|nr:MAG: 6,7-dimethyl-8-ribityllumazine synthase [Deltaproteobacteria bacterium RBG_13_65_10]